MRILILGGTGFIGPHIVEFATERGHEVTLFNRGETNPELFADLEQRRGDRFADPSDLSELEEGEWDAVIDTTAYFPREVREVLEVLDERIDHYLLVSTISVYEEYDPSGYDERAPLASLDDPTTEEVNWENYGGLKVLCERAARKLAPGRLTIVRPGVVVGPRDTTDRFTYWPARFDHWGVERRGSEVLCPGSPDHPLQYIDVRDLAEFIVDALDDAITGTYNTVVPPGTYDFGDLVDACRQATPAKSQPTWVDTDFLLDHGVEPWTDLPLWAPPGTDAAGTPHASAARAIDAGLNITPIEDTVATTLKWFRGLPRERKSHLEAGIDTDRERELLEAWNVVSGEK